MTAELTSEEIVTKLLLQNEILEPAKNNFFVTNPQNNTLGEFLDFNSADEPPAHKLGDILSKSLTANKK